VDIAALMDPPITVISRDITRVGQVAAELLLRRINGDKSNGASRQFIPTELVVRESCAPHH
jgi:LacI family transcriptional regulator